jgi:hypothetical protein
VLLFLRELEDMGAMGSMVRSRDRHGSINFGVHGQYNGGHDQGKPYVGEDDTQSASVQVLLETSEPVTQSDIGDRNPHSLHIRRKEQLGKVIQYNIRPFLFVVVFLLVMFYLLGFRYYAEATKSVLTVSDSSTALHVINHRVHRTLPRSI